MNKTKKYIIFAIIAVLLVAASATASVLLLNRSHTPASDSNQPAPSSPVTNQSDADASIKQAETLSAKQDYSGAISAYQKAKEYYTSAKDPEEVARIDAQISMLEAQQKQTPVKPGLVNTGK